MQDSQLYFCNIFSFALFIRIDLLLKMFMELSLHYGTNINKFFSIQL